MEDMKEKKMSWQQIRNAFPKEWVCLTDYQVTGGVAVDGIVIAHAAEKITFREQVKKLDDHFKNIAVRFTGDSLIKNPDIPLLWQISHTS